MKEPGSPRKVRLGACFQPQVCAFFQETPVMLYLAIDQHKRQLTVNLRSEDGTVILKRQVSTRWEKVRAFFAELAEKVRRRRRLPGDPRNLRHERLAREDAPRVRLPGDRGGPAHGTGEAED